MLEIFVDALLLGMLLVVAGLLLRRVAGRFGAALPRPLPLARRRTLHCVRPLDFGPDR